MAASIFRCKKKENIKIDSNTYLIYDYIESYKNV